MTHAKTLDTGSSEALAAIRQALTERGCTGPTWIEPPKSPAAVRDQQEKRKDAAVLGQWGRTQVGKERIFWAALARISGHRLTLKGFASTLAEAEDAARAALLDSFPVGAVFVFSAAYAGLTYKQRHAKVTRFSGDWRTQFPEWAERQHLYHTSYSSCGQAYEEQFTVVAVTNKYVFIRNEADAQPELSTERVRRSDCIGLPRQTLEASGQAYSAGFGGLFTIEPMPSAQAQAQGDTAQRRRRMVELRRQMQQLHPDKGTGDAAQFIELRREFDNLRRIDRMASNA